MADIFISYRREGGADTARLIRDSLQKRGYDVFLDVEDLRSGHFNEALYQQIDKAADFLSILSPNSLDRCQNDNDWVRLEIAYAIKHKKNLVPVIHKGFTWPAVGSLPKDIADLPTYNGVSPSHELFEASIDKLTKLLKSRPRGQRAKSVTSALPIAAVVVAAIVAVFSLYGSRQPTVNLSDRPGDIEKFQSIRASLNAIDQKLVSRPKESIDYWTSPPVILTFVPLDTQAVPPKRQATATALDQAMIEAIKNTTEFSVVDRESLAELLQEVELSATELADQRAATPSGRFLPASILMKRAVSMTRKTVDVKITLIDVQTSEIIEIITDRIGGRSLTREALIPLAKRVAAVLKKKFPAKGRVTAVRPGEATINIGSLHGVASGAVFGLYADDTEAARALADSRPSAVTAMVVSLDRFTSVLQLDGAATEIKVQMPVAELRR